MEELIRYTGNLTWLKESTIFFARHGSHAYGLNTPTSDEDFKGVAIPPRDYFLGFAHRFEQAEQKDPDLVVYDLRKFMSLAADCNPSIIEVLWSEPLIVTKAGEQLMAARDAFLSRKAKHTFCGYALQQLKRIKGHHRWLKAPPTAPPTRADMGLPERTVIPSDQLAAAQAAVQKKMGEWSLDFLGDLEPSQRIEVQSRVAEIVTEMKISTDDQYAAAARTIGYDDNFIRILDLERQYTARKREWDQYQNWRATRNPTRADLEANHGFDTKHAMHLVRLLRMCREILTEGKVIVRRPDREELLAIRNGAWSYEQLVEWAEREDLEMQTLAKSSPLPHAPDRAALDRLCIDLVGEAVLLQVRDEVRGEG